MLWSAQAISAKRRVCAIQAASDLPASSAAAAAEWDGERRESREHHWRVDEHPAIAKHRVEAQSIGRRDGQQAEWARNNHQHHQQEALDCGQDPGGVGGKAQPQRRACDQEALPRRPSTSAQ